MTSELSYEMSFADNKTPYAVYAYKEKYMGIDLQKTIKYGNTNKKLELTVIIKPDSLKIGQITIKQIFFNSEEIDLEKVLEEPEKVYNLNLNLIQFTFLSKRIKEFKNLKELYLLNNSLISMPQDIRRLKNLVKLDLRFNSITYFRPEIKELKNLKHLILIGNPISEREKAKIKSWLPNTEIEF